MTGVQDRNNGERTGGDGRFQSGNPGRPRGARHKATVAAELLLDGDAEKLTRKAIDMALEGDMVALRLCLERILPARRDRPVAFSLPTMRSAADLVPAYSAIAGGVADGELTPGEAQELARIIEGSARAIELTDIEQRLAALEKQSRGAK